MTAKPSVKISYPRTLGAIKNVIHDAFGLHIVLTPLAKPLAIINNIKLRVFFGKTKLVEEQIKTLLKRSGQPISTVVETIADTAAVTRVIVVPLAFDVPKGSRIVFSYKDENDVERIIKLNL